MFYVYANFAKNGVPLNSRAAAYVGRYRTYRAMYRAYWRAAGGRAYRAWLKNARAYGIPRAELVSELYVSLFGGSCGTWARVSRRAPPAGTAPRGWAYFGL